MNQTPNPCKKKDENIVGKAEREQSRPSFGNRLGAANFELFQ